MLPGAPRSTSERTTACMRKNGPRRFTAMCASNSSGVVSSSVPRAVSPAAFTRQSTCPYPASTASTAATAAAAPPTSAGTYPAAAPVAVSSAASASPRSWFRPSSATTAPSRTAARATPAPTPWVPPLTRTTFPSRRGTTVSLAHGSAAEPYGVARRSIPDGGASRDRRSLCHLSRLSRSVRRRLSGTAAEPRHHRIPHLRRHSDPHRAGRGQRRDLAVVDARSLRDGRGRCRRPAVLRAAAADPVQAEVSAVVVRLEPGTAALQQPGGGLSRADGG